MILKNTALEWSMMTLALKKTRHEGDCMGAFSKNRSL